MPISFIPNIPASSAQWGEITGDISTQADLANSLDSKAANVHLHEIADIKGLQDVLNQIIASINPNT